MALVTVMLQLLLLVTVVSGHGRLLEPPSRSSMWRFGFPTPRNTDDHTLDCGGIGVLWSNGGRCLCGDPYNAPRHENEAGGKYATGTIGRVYTEGQIIHIRIEITVAHGGWSEFRICPNNNIYRDPSQACLDKHLLASPQGTTRFYHSRRNGMMTLTLQIPRGITCTQCLFQWMWNTDSSNNCNPVTGKNCCIGCGPQERFVNCADVAVTPLTTGPYPTAAPPTRAPPTRAPSINSLPDNFQLIPDRPNPWFPNKPSRPTPYRPQGTKLPDGFQPIGGGKK